MSAPIPHDVLVLAIKAARKIHDTGRPHSLIIAEAIMADRKARSGDAK